MYILLFLLILVIVVIVIGLSIVGAVLRAIFGFGRRSSSQTQKTTQQQTYGRRTYQHSYQSDQDNSSYYNKEDNLSEKSHPRQKKKIFDKEDGEYIDFEEIKEKR